MQPFRKQVRLGAVKEGLVYATKERMEARREDLKPGMVVNYGGSRAIVQRVMKNGVRIAFDGKGLRRGEYLHKTVSAKHLEVR